MESVRTIKDEGSVPRERALVPLALTVSPFGPGGKLKLGEPDGAPGPLSQAVKGGADVGKTVSEPAKTDGKDAKGTAVAQGTNITETDELCESMKSILTTQLGDTFKRTWISAIETIGEIGGPKLFAILINESQLHINGSPTMDQEIEKAVVSAATRIVQRIGPVAFGEIDETIMQPKKINSNQLSFASAIALINVIREGGPSLKEVGEKLLREAIISAATQKEVILAELVHAEALDAFRAIYGLEAK